MIASDARTSRTHVVGEQDTAIALGSGDMPVLATPRLLAWIEAATVAAVADQLPPGSTSVGVIADVHHSAPTPVGAEVIVSAQLESVDGPRVTFTVEARQVRTSSGAAAERAVFAGTVVRAVVDRDRFLARL